MTDISMPSVFVKDGAVYANSRDVAAFFEKRHADVLRAIRDVQCSECFHRRNFAPCKIKDLTGESTSHYEMTKDGFAFLVLGFTGADAARFKEAYIAAFNAMEAELSNRRPSRPIVPDARDMEFVRLAKQVKGDGFASALWDDMGFYCPSGFEPIRQRSLFEPTNQNITIAITHAA